jgi:AcrR family transcriptional regulator
LHCGRRYYRGIAASAQRTEKGRDADRSRETILDAAEALFAERGYDGVSLSDIGAASGLSRATPSYFFGSKAGLYRAVLDRASADRRAATAEATASIAAWCDDGGDLKALRKALRQSLDAYIALQLSRPTPAGADGAAGLEELFAKVRKGAKKRGLVNFEVEDAVVLWASLASAPPGTRDLTDGKARKRHVRFAADQLLFLLAGS